MSAAELSADNIRNALVDRIRLPGRLIRYELGLLNHTVRADVAALDYNALSLFEVKSERDTLKRLPAQVETYSLVADRAAVVLTGRHLDKAVKIVPQWWGVLIATSDCDGVALGLHREAEENPSPDASSIARMLWSDELAVELRARGVRGASRATQKERAGMLASVLPLEPLRDLVFSRLRTRVLGGFGRAA